MPKMTDLPEMAPYIPITEAQVPAAERSSDPFHNVPNVLKLDRYTFLDYLKSKDVVLVMFYEPGDSTSLWTAKYFKQAATTNKRSNSGFAAVDCLAEKDLCVANDAVCNIPMFTLFSGTYVVGSIREPLSFTATCMKNFVENAPVLSKPRGC